MEYASSMHDVSKISGILAQQETVGLLAKFAHDIVAAYKSVPLYIPALALSD